MRWATPYQGARSCTGGPTPGARAVLAWILESYEGAESMGIYNCRSVAGTSTTSLHGEGRAVDVDPDGTRGRSGFQTGRRLVAELGEHGARLGIQAVIYNRTIWSNVSPNGRPYGGVHPHDDHLHIELTRNAAQNLTLATLRAVLGDRRESPVTPPPPPPPPRPPSDWRQEVIAKMETVNLSRVTSASRTWVRGPAVARAQGLLLAHGHGPAGLVGKSGRPDGVAGPATKRAVDAFQRRHRVGKASSPSTPDSIVGRGTWSKLNGV